MKELIAITENGAILSRDTVEKIAEFERMAKEIKTKQDELKARILDEMEQKCILKLETPEMVISYVAETTRETLDSKALKEELPDIYDTYAKISPVKASIRIRVKA